MAQRKALQDGGPGGVNSDKDQRKCKVTVDFDVLAALALYAPAELIESYYRETRKTAKRLKLGQGKNLKKVEEVGTYPNVLDVKRWLDQIEKHLRFHREDRVFLKDFNTTMENRLPPSKLKQIAEEEQS